MGNRGEKGGGYAHGNMGPRGKAGKGANKRQNLKPGKNNYKKTPAKTSRGAKTRNSGNNTDRDGCAVVALAALGGAAGLLGAVAWKMKEVLS